MRQRHVSWAFNLSLGRGLSVYVVESGYAPIAEHLVHVLYGLDVDSNFDTVDPKVVPHLTIERHQIIP